MNFTLPSGRTLELHDPTWGEELHVVSVGAENIEEMIYAKFAVMVPSLTREEVAALSRTDGRALATEVGRLWDGRPDEQEAPFESESAKDSKDAPLTTPS